MEQTQLDQVRTRLHPVPTADLPPTLNPASPHPTPCPMHHCLDPSTPVKIFSPSPFPRFSGPYLLSHVRPSRWPKRTFKSVHLYMARISRTTCPPIRMLRSIIRWRGRTRASPAAVSLRSHPIRTARTHLRPCYGRTPRAGPHLRQPLKAGSTRHSNLTLTPSLMEASA